MIQNETNDLQTVGALPGEKTAMDIDPAAFALIMKSLTDLYSDPELAVIREYSTNAWDAHQEVGNPDPIMVTLPSPLSPFFKVRDHGVGLSGEDIANTYARYGASTKRNTNKQVGMLGYGCKSALTYVQQFTVTSVKDGERIQVAITREATGGSMTVVDRRPAKDDEPNGTEITIPAKRTGHGNYHSMIDRAEEFFSFWPAGSVLVNGKEPAKVEGLKLSDTILVRKAKDAYNSKHRVVMGNVAYPIEPGRVNVSVAHGHEVIFYVDIGEINFTPSREGLNYEDTTIATLKRLQEEFAIEAKNAIQREVNNAATPTEAITKLMESRVMLADSRKYGEYTYKGKRVPSKFEVPGAPTSYPWNYTPDTRLLAVPRNSYVANRADEEGALALDYFPGALWVTGYEGKKFSAPQKKKLLKFVDEEFKGDGNAVTRFILLKDEPKAVKFWIDPTMIVKWDDVNAVKIERNVSVYGGYKNIPGSYDNVTVDGEVKSEVAANDIDTSKPLYWYSGSWYHVGSYSLVLDKKHPKGYTIVPLPANRKDKFLRNFPQAQELHAAVAKMAADWAKSVTDTQKQALAMANSGWAGIFQKLPEAEINDPEVKKACKLAQNDLTSVTAARKMYRDVVGQPAGLEADWENPLLLGSYPLVDQYDLERGLRDENFRKHYVLYLNAAHAA